MKRNDMRWKLLIIIMLAVALLTPMVRHGIVFEFELLSERFHFGCIDPSDETMVGCMSKHFDAVAREEGAKVAIAEVRDRYDTSPRLAHACHQILHTIGRAAAANERSIGALFSDGDPICWSGYYHGVMEGKLRNIATTSIDEAFVNGICADIPHTRENYFHYYNCIHGAGHAFMYASHNDLPYALSRCAMVHDSDDSENCATGAFMENIVASESDHGTDYINESDPLYPCDDPLSERFRHTCYQVQATVIWNAHHDPKRAFGTCHALSDEADRDGCLEGVGREIAASTENDPLQSARQCRALDDRHTEDICIRGALKNFLAYYHDKTKATELCLATSASIRESCTKLLSDFSVIFQETVTTVR